MSTLVVCTNPQLSRGNMTQNMTQPVNGQTGLVCRRRAEPAAALSPSAVVGSVNKVGLWCNMGYHRTGVAWLCDRECD